MIFRAENYVREIIAVFTIFLVLSWITTTTNFGYSFFPCSIKFISMANRFQYSLGYPGIMYGSTFTGATFIYFTVITYAIFYQINLRLKVIDIT